MKYFKRYWDETTGEDLTDSWGRSWYYFETDDELNVIRQIQHFENGQALTYDTEYSEDKLGGLATVPLDEEFLPFLIDKAEFEWLWNRVSDSSSIDEFDRNVLNGGNDFKIESNWYMIND